MEGTDTQNEPADKDSDAFGKSIHRETYKERSIGDIGSCSGGLIVELIRATTCKISLLPFFPLVKKSLSNGFCVSVSSAVDSGSDLNAKPGQHTSCVDPLILVEEHC